MVEKKTKNTAMASKEERAQIRKNVTKVDPDDEDPIGCEFNYVFVFVMQLQYFWSSWYQSENYSHES